MKKMITLGLCLTMALAFAAGCKKADENATPATSATPATAPAQTPMTSAQAPAPAATPATPATPAAPALPAGHPTTAPAADQK